MIDETEVPPGIAPEGIVEVEAVPIKFSELGLNEDLQRVIDDLGWVTPTPIQATAIPIILERHDCIGVAQTGTGKTGAFIIPILERLRGPGEKIGALILEPTRELAIQVKNDLDRLATPLGIRHAVVYGGTGVGPQRHAITQGLDILVATPGRLLDLMEQMLISWGELRFLVLDEADRMLDMGFLPDVERILRKMPMARQTLLFTATMEPSIRVIADHHMLSPKEANIGYVRTVASGITQYIYPVRQDEKARFLLALLDKFDIDSGIIFTRMKTGADQIGELLVSCGYDAGVIHADRMQSAREKTLGRFRSGELSLLVATDVAARGLDISGVTHVINLDVPQNPDDYIHRVGRTGRNTAEGDAITLVSSDEEFYLDQVEKLIGYKLKRSILPEFTYYEDPLNRVPSKGKPRRGGSGGGGGGRRPSTGTKSQGQSQSRGGRKPSTSRKPK